MAQQLRHRRLVARVDPIGTEAAVVQGRNRRLGPRRVLVGHHHRLEERAAGGDPGDGGADTAGAHVQDTHDRSPCPED